MENNTARLSVSWKSIAITMSIIALMAMTSTAIIATINKADTLSTVALGLAVIAFVIQIIVYIVQADAASKQELKSQEIYGSTLKALAAIEEKAEGTRATVSLINDKMIDFALGKTITQAESVGVSLESPEFSTLLTKSINDYAESIGLNQPVHASSLTFAENQVPQQQASAMLSIEDSRDLSMLRPPDRVATAEALSLLEKFDPSALSSLERLANDQYQYGGSTNGTEVGFHSISNAERLREAGLIKRVRNDRSKEPVVVLTDKGKEVSRILINQDALPEYAHRIADLRNAIDQFRDEVKDSAKRRMSVIPVEPA